MKLLCSLKISTLLRLGSAATPGFAGVEMARTSRGLEELEEEGKAGGGKKRTCLAKAREVVDLRPWKVGI